MERQELSRLLQHPSERLDTELKRWIDPSSDEGKAKIAKGCIALRNNDGGHLIIGFQDDGQPDPAIPQDVRTMFRADLIQGIVSRYASETFAVEVELVELAGVEYPIIVVPRGVETPVAAKADLPHQDRKKPPLIRCNTVYVRTLNSNGTVSSSEINWKDWPKIIRACFDNREADIGAFIRRHLSFLTAAQHGLAVVSPSKRATDFLDDGRRRFEEMRRKKGEPPAPKLGTFEVAIVIDGTIAAVSANADFYRRLQLNKPRYTGWALWPGEYSPPNDVAYTFQDGWESLSSGPYEGSFDFWRAETSGRFYHLRNLWDDSQSAHGIVPKTKFDFALHTACVTEAVAIGAHFARLLGCDELATTLGIACRWAGLEGRILYSWGDPDRGFVSAPAVQDTKTTTTVVRLETPTSAYAPVVESLVAPLFELFGGTKFESDVIDQIVRKTLSHRY